MNRRIASIYYEPKSARRPLYSGIFDLPACPKGQPAVIIEITDHIQWEKLPHIMGGGQRPITVFAQDIAPDLIREWVESALGMTQECGPGIWQVRDYMPLLDEQGIPVVDNTRTAQFRPATEEEKAAMWAEDLAMAKMRQENWINLMIQKGDEMWDDVKRRPYIDVHMKAAAEYRGATPEWLKSNVSSDSKLCQFCLKSIGAKVVKCPFCSEIVDNARYRQLRDQGKLTAA